MISPKIAGNANATPPKGPLLRKNAAGASTEKRGGKRDSREMARLRGEIDLIANRAPFCFGPGRQSLMERFAAAEAAGEIEVARELVAIARNAGGAEPERRQHPPSAEEKAASWQKMLRERAFQEEVQRWIIHGPRAILTEIEAHGTVRLRRNGTLSYTGDHLGEALLAALGHHGAAVRCILAERWHDRILLPAQERCLRNR